MRMRIALSVLAFCVIIILSCMQSVASDEFVRLNNEGYKHLRNGEYERGIENFDQALRLNPDYGLAHGNRGIAYFILGRFEDALRDFQAVRTQLPHSDVGLKLYLAGARMGKSDPAVLTDIEAHNAAPDAFLAIAIADYYLGKKTRDALLQDVKSRKLNKEWLCWAYFYIGEGALLEGNRFEAVRLLQLSADNGVKDRPEFMWAKAELQNLRAAPTQASAPITASTPDNGVLQSADANTEKPKEGLKSTAGEPAIPIEDRARNDRGSIEGQTYKNALRGIELIVPEELTFRVPETNGSPGTEQKVLIISADSKPRNRFSFRKYIVDEEVKLIADPLAMHSLDERSTDGYMRFASHDVASTGFKQIDGPATATIGDVQFLRGNFVQGHRRHTLLVTIHKDYGICLVIASNDAETAERLIKSIVLKLTP